MAVMQDTRVDGLRSFRRPVISRNYILYQEGLMDHTHASQDGQVVFPEATDKQPWATPRDDVVDIASVTQFFLLLGDDGFGPATGS